jgi:hypothetical protein
MKLAPVPVAIVVIKCVMPMAIVHLFCASSCLISLSPAAFYLLSIRLTRIFDVIECPDELTCFNVILDVHLGNRSSHSINQMCHFWKIFGKSLLQIDVVRAPDVVTQHDPA